MVEVSVAASGLETGTKLALAWEKAWECVGNRFSMSDGDNVGFRVGNGVGASVGSGVGA